MEPLWTCEAFRLELLSRSYTVSDKRGLLDSGRWIILTDSEDVTGLRRGLPILPAKADWLIPALALAHDLKVMGWRPDFSNLTMLAKVIGRSYGRSTTASYISGVLDSHPSRDLSTSDILILRSILCGLRR